MAKLPTTKTPADKPEKPAKKDEVASVRAQLNYLTRQLEKMFGRDFNGDGRIGSVRTLILISVVAVFVAVSIMYAAEDEVVRYIAREGNDVVLTLEADQGDDAGDELQVGITAAGLAFISVGGANVLTIDASGDISAPLLQDGTTNSLTVGQWYITNSVVTVFQ